MQTRVAMHIENRNAYNRKSEEINNYVNKPFVDKIYDAASKYYVVKNRK